MLSVFVSPFIFVLSGCKVVVDSERYGNFIVAPTLVRQLHWSRVELVLAPTRTTADRVLCESVLGFAAFI